MKARTVFSLVGIGSAIYFISRDKSLREKVMKLIPADKMNEITGKVDEIVTKAYDKLCIAHKNEISKLRDEIEELKQEVEGHHRGGPAVE